MRINPLNIISLLTITFNKEKLGIQPSEVTPEEVHLHDVIEDIIMKNVFDSSFIIENSVDLQFAHEDSQIDIQPIEDEEQEEEKDYGEVPSCLYQEERVNFDYKKEAVDFWNSGKKKRLSFTTVHQRFKKLRSERQLRRWQEQVNSGGDREDKLYNVAKYTFDNLKEAIDSKMTVHDIDLRRWALQKKHELDMPWFKASRWWVWKFKKMHNVVSRKITKFISISSLHDTRDTEQECDVFKNNVKSEILRYGESKIFNSDQSGFNLELHSGRTLSFKGTKTVENVVQSVSSTTHSYTIQPTISADGRLLSPLFVVLKEPSGEFGPRVSQGLFQANNIYLQASKSGKLSSELLQMWLQDVFFPNVGENSVLLLDSWSGQCEQTVQTAIPEGKTLLLKTIPKGTTGKIQPLDVFGFRIWKNFVRKISDTSILLRSDINLHIRNNIIKLQSLTHNQLSSPRFINVFKYSWYKSGYIENRPPHFDNPVDFCFNEDIEPFCDICGDVAVITCAWCKKRLCLKHFFEEYHYCENFVP